MGCVCVGHKLRHQPWRTILLAMNHSTLAPVYSSIYYLGLFCILAATNTCHARYSSLVCVGSLVATKKARLEVNHHVFVWFVMGSTRYEYDRDWRSCRTDRRILTPRVMHPRLAPESVRRSTSTTRDISIVREGSTRSEYRNRHEQDARWGGRNRQ